MTLCMGMALSAPPDRSALPGAKAGLVTRFRRKWNWLKDDHGAHAKGDESKRVRKRSLISEIPRRTPKPQQSDRQDRLQPSPKESRRFSVNGPRLSSRSLQPIPSRSATSLNEASLREGGNNGNDTASLPDIFRESESEPQITAVASVASEDGFSEMDDGEVSKDGAGGELILRTPSDEEMDWRWILNLSMHFRDQSDREKFFVTYAEKPNLRRRLTVSCDYRDAEEGTLEKELADLRYQRDKSAKIYEAIKDSLPSIQFYETITNLKLQTSNGRLHVHVTEDVHEIIPYPPVIAIAHLRCPKYRESDLEFESHLSGFVYKVKVHGEVFIKKEIPGPDTVDEFLYEINALYALADSEHVIRFGGCIVDDKREKVKGLLISFASKGALIDIIFHEKGQLPWRLREKWAKQIVSGLSEVHEAGYVQGDFTLSNIVIDEEDNAKIIDINRRGCPVGWEPPEVTAMIDGLQRIGMYIGVKSDIFQLGMVLWGIAHEMDEPEAVSRPLGMHMAPEDVPQYFRDIVDACLCDRPQGRMSAKDIVALFPEHKDGYIPRLGRRFPDEDTAGIEGAGSRHGYVIGEPIDGIVEVTLNGNGPNPQIGESSGYTSGVTGLLLNGTGPQEQDKHSNSTFTHVYSPPEPGHGLDRSEGGAEGRAYPETQRIQTQFYPDEDPQVISASPSESGGAVGEEQSFFWPSIAGAVSGAGTGANVAESPAMSPTTVPLSRRATNTRESVGRGEDRPLMANSNESNPPDEPVPRPTMNGRAATKDSEIGEKFTTARSSIDTRKSVAVSGKLVTIPTNH